MELKKIIIHLIVKTIGKERLRIKLKKAGFGFILLTLLLGFTAVNSNNNLTYLIVSIMLSLMTISGVLAVINLLGIQINNLETEIFTAKKDGFIPLMIQNKKIIPSFLINVYLNDLCLNIPYIRPLRSEISWIKWRPNERGVYTFNRLQIGSSFPFSFIWRGFEKEIQLTVIVAPEPLKLLFPPSTSGINSINKIPSMTNGTGDWFDIKWTPKIERKSGVIWRKIDWNLRELSRNKLPYPSHHFTNEGNHFYLDLNDTQLKGFDLETRLKIIRYWLDYAYSINSSWTLKFEEKSLNLSGKSGYLTSLKLLAEYNPL